MDLYPGAVAEVPYVSINDNDRLIFAYPGLTRIDSCYSGKRDGRSNTWPGENDGGKHEQ
ncbi:MAG: hypothetical protein O7E57_16630 [Gammaproteobacteria bacterium]|nr:hypothetical protein [Gammaproteobacteria bacterium]